MMFSVRRSLAWMAVSQGGLFIIQFGTSLVIARLLTPYEMGVFAIAVAIVGLLATIRGLGLSGYIVRATELDASLIATVFTVNAALALLVSAVIALLSMLGGALLGEPGVRRLLLVMAVLPLISIFEFLPAAGVERLGEFRAVAVVNLIRTFVGNAVMLGFALNGFSYMSLAYGQLAGAGAGVVGINLVGWRHASLRLGIAGWRDIMRYGMHMLAISGINVLAYRMAELLLGRLLGLSALGLYSRASGLNSLLWDNFYFIIVRVVFVDFSEQRRRGGSLRYSYLRILQMMTGLLWPAFAGLAVIAGPLVVTLYGERWTEAALPFTLLCLTSIIAVSIAMTWEVFVVCEETARQARFEFMRALVGLVLVAAGCLISLAAAAAARIGDTLFAVALYRPHIERMTDTRTRDCVPIYLHGAILTVVAVLPAAVVMTVYDWSPHAPVPAILAGVALGVLAWVAGLRALRHPLFDEGRIVVSRLRPG